MKTDLSVYITSLFHRGPDDSGIVVFKNNGFLGHTRLSIQDISSLGHQPMWTSDKQVCIVFNGEIYNFKALREELVDQFTFVSTSDTEVLLYGYYAWGIDLLLQKCNGIFSFCIYDTRSEEVYLARDQLGVKPLVYHRDEQSIRFASELKALLDMPGVSRVMNPESLIDYMVYRYVATPKTMFDGVYKVIPGTYHHISLETLAVTEHRYWTLPNISVASKFQICNPKEHIHSQLRQAIERQLVADTPVTTFLSGGIDSSLVSVIAKEYKPDIEAITVDFDGSSHTELPFAQQVATLYDIPLHVCKVGPEEVEEALSEVIRAYDDPIADSSIVPTYLLNKHTKALGFKVALAGDGADELFFGYAWHEQFARLEQLRPLLRYIPQAILPKKYERIGSICKEKLATERYRRLVYDRFTTREVSRLFNIPTPNNSAYLYDNVLSCAFEISTMRTLDIKTFLLDDILYKVDIASMRHGVEVRVPYLDIDMVTVALQLSQRQAFPKNQRKFILKEIAKDYLPEDIVYRKKHGFSAPMQELIPKAAIMEQLRTGYLISHHILSQDRDHLELLSYGKLWQLYVLDRWAEVYQPIPFR